MCTTLFKCQVLGNSYRIVKDKDSRFIVERYFSSLRKWKFLSPSSFGSYKSAVIWLSYYLRVKFLGAAYSSEFLRDYKPTFDF